MRLSPPVAAERLLTPTMRGVLDRIRRAGLAPFHTQTPQQARRAYLQAAEILDLPRAPLPRVENLQVPGAAGALDARLYAASREPGLPLLLYLHGGGFVVGGIETHDSLCRQLTLRSGGAVLSLDYRLAPEHRFPAAHDDTWAVLRWLHAAGAARLGCDAARLAIGGDSAGGTLAAACALEARDAGLPLALQLLITPGMAAQPGFPSRQRFASGFLLEQVGIDWFFDHAIARERRSDWRFSPLQAEDVSGVAPACLIVAECDPLADEDVAYADRLRAAGVALHFDLVRGVTHDFIKMGRALKEARRAQQFAAAALIDAWSTPAMTDAAPQRKDFRFAERHRVRWAEVDMQAIVFNGHYLMYFDTAVAGYWRALGMPYHETMHELGGDLHVRKATLEYEASARYDEALDTGIRCARIGNSSMLLQAAVFRGEQRLVHGELVYVFADPATQTSRPVPVALREWLQAFERGEAMVDVSRGDWAALGAVAGPIRRAVFTQEQGIDAALDDDGADAEAVHVVAVNRLGTALGTGRLVQQGPHLGKIGRMAVVASLRGSSVGRQMLDALVTAARQRGDRQVMLHAQASAVGFYRRLGWQPQGPAFVEAGVEHLEMVLPLA